jgi:hypothetical protein
MALNRSGRVAPALALACAVCALALSAAACGSDQEATPAWAGPSRPLPANGTLPVEAFDAYLDAVGKPLTLSRVAIAAAYVLPLVGDASRMTVTQLTESMGGAPPVVVMVDALDRYVAEQRYELAIEDGTDGLRLVSGRWSQRCQAGRGHQEWSPEPCR